MSKQGKDEMWSVWNKIEIFVNQSFKRDNSMEYSYKKSFAISNNNNQIVNTKNKKLILTQI